MPDDQPGAEAVRRLDEVAAHLSNLSTALAEEEDLGRVLQRSVDQVISAVPGADMVSVTVLRDGKGETVAASDRRVWDIDQDQYAAGDGPCLEAARTRQPVRAGVSGAAQRWPEFARSSRKAGVESYLAHPLILDEDFAGSMNLYSDEHHGFKDFDVALLAVYVTAASSSIGSARRHARAREATAQLTAAIESRAVIDQAIGVLIARSGTTPERAFEELARQSQNTNVKLRDIATQLVASQQHPQS